MSYHVCFGCACREVDFGASARFTYVVWDDLTGLLDKVAPNPYRWCRNLSGQEVVDGGELHRWWESYLAALEEARDRLPTLYEIWQPFGQSEGSAAGYFRIHGDAYMALGTYDKLTAREVDEMRWGFPPAGVPYAPPEVSEVAPDLADELFMRARPDRDGRNELRLTVEEFERIFRGTPLRLEHGNLLDFYADELRELSDAARHAAQRGETVEFYQY